MEVASRLGIDGVSKSDIFSYLEDVSGRYGMIVALDVIEHFRKDEIFAILDLVHQALRAGGLFLMQTPNGMSKYGRWYRTYDFTHETIFDAESARQCLSAIGFRNVVIKPVPPVVHGMPSAVRAVLWRFWEPMLKLSFAVESGWQPEQVFTPNLLALAYKKAERGAASGR